jgi:hypothetical protein
MGYTSCKADPGPDLWLKAMTRPEDNVRYYAYILCYVDDILCLHHDPMSVMKEINSYLPLKPSSVGEHLSQRKAERDSTTQWGNGVGT